jgi:hypothetical protein
MSSEHLASAKDHLKGDLGGSWNILDGASGQYTDLGIARKFGGSAAAYSLRDIGAMNGPVVRVRRSSDSTEAIDDEQNFSANQVASGALENWVNGKLENVLPADVATAAAAYSLRKVKADYSDDAVRIRRTSDSTEVDVAFDSSDKVSSSSAVTNVTEQGGESGSTNATDLNGFLNEEHEITNTSSTWNNKSASGVQGTVNEASSTLIDFTVTQLQNSGGGSTDNMWLFKLENHNNVGIGKVRISLDCTHFDFQNGGTVIVQPFYDKNGDGSNAYSTEISITSTGSFSAEIEPLSFQTAQAFRLFHTDTEVGDRVRIENLKVESLKSSATVHTWYDQSPSGNDATQTTAANQPVIAEDGVLLTDGIDFDGSASYLDATSALGATATVGAFIVHKPDTTDANRYLIDNRDASNDGMRIMQREESSGNYRVSMDTTEVNSASGSVTTNETLLTAIQSSTALTLFKNSVSQATAADDAISVTATFRIGANRVSLGTYFDGTMKEIILFTSDQTDDRFKIESNINNYYNLYNDANDTSDTEWQFHNTETGTSANGTDGYVFKNSDADVGIASLELKEGVVSGDIIYYSFFYDRTTGSPTVRLASDETDSTSGVSNSDAVGTSTGFVSGTLTATGTGSFFMIADNDNPSDFTISNFRMSRIARNGFIETWYDQSGNGKDATQSTAADQPKIVGNGAVVIETQGKPAIQFSTSKEFLLISNTNLQSLFSVVSNGDVSSDEQTIIANDGVNNKYVRLLSGGTDYNPIVKNGATDLTFADLTSGEQDVGIIFVYNRTDANNNTVHINNSSKAITSGTDTDLNADIDVDRIGTRNSNLDPWAGKMQEIIVFDKDMSSDRTDLQNDMANFYNITLS